MKPPTPDGYSWWPETVRRLYDQASGGSQPAMDALRAMFKKPAAHDEHLAVIDAIIELSGPKFQAELSKKLRAIYGEDGRGFAALIVKELKDPGRTDEERATLEKLLTQLPPPTSKA